MFHRFAALCVLMFAALACTTTTVQVMPVHSPSDDVINHALQSTISLYTLSGTRVCAGQRVSPTEVLTAYHCAVGAVKTNAQLNALDDAGIDFNEVDESEVLDHKGMFSTYHDVLNETGLVRTGVFVRTDPERDLAVMIVARDEQPYVTLRAQPLPVGAEVFAIGHPAGLDYTYTHGYVSMACRTLPQTQDVCWTQVDITIWGGSSGGGLYDLAGNLIGVASMMRRPGQAYFVYPEYVAKIVHSPVSK